MDAVFDYIKQLLQSIPKEVIFAVLLVAILTEVTKMLIAKLETVLEAKKGKEIKIFDHKKILLVIFWSLLFAILLAVAKIYTWTQVPLYFFAILGTSSFFYELIIKKMKQLRGTDE